MFFTFVLVYVPVFASLFVHEWVVVQLSVRYGNLNICLTGLQIMKAHSFLNFIFFVIREKNELYILSLESATSIQKPINLLKVVYHPVSCLWHHYISVVFQQNSFQVFGHNHSRGVGETFKQFRNNLVFLNWHILWTFKLLEELGFIWCYCR